MKQNEKAPRENLNPREESNRQNQKNQNVDTKIGRGNNKGDTENLSSNEGGTTDLGAEGRGSRPSRATGSGLGSKTSVTGSDYDGQVG